MHLSRSFASAACARATPAAVMAASSAFRVSIGGPGACEHPAISATAKLAATTREGARLVRMVLSPPGMLRRTVLRLGGWSRRQGQIRAPHIDNALPVPVRLLPPDLGIFPMVGRRVALGIVRRQFVGAVRV